MANGTKEYKIVINGITESVDAVKSLNSQLDKLEQRMNALSSAKVSTGGGSASSRGNVSALSEEEAVQKEINKLKQEGERLDAKIVAAQDEIYKRVDATKQLYKETVADQKAIAAQERLVADAYSNTMAGMKAKLADIKSVINVTDLGDSDKIKQMTKDANDLTNKLKEMEEAYGQYGRNVGNYANGVAEGLQKVKITVGDTVREFNNATQASRTLNKELKTMAANGQQNTEEFKELQQVVMELDSNIADAKKPMDDLMDSMEGIMAVANVGQGIRALFGVDDTEIQKSIKNLVALQNVLKGIESINEQIQTRQGVGKWIAPFTTQVDKATTKLLAFNTALLGTGKASKVAATGIKLFSKALKVAFSAGILIVVDLLVDKLMDLVESLKKADEATERSKKIQEEAGKAYAEASAKILQYQNRIKNFNGSRKEEKKLVEDLNKDLGSTLGTYKSLAEWKEVLKKKTDAYIQSMILEAQQQAILNQLIDVYTQKWNAVKHMKDDFSWGEQIQSFFMGSNSVYNDRRNVVNQLDEQAKQLEGQLKKNAEALEKFNQENGIGNYAPQIEKNTDKTKKALEEEQKTLNELQLRLMKDGLNKKLMQLDEEERQTLNKLKENGRKNADAIKKIESIYTQLRAKEIKEYLKVLEESVRKTSRELSNIQFDLNLKDIDNEINILQNKLDELGNKVPRNMTLSSRADFNDILNKHSQNEYAAVRQHNLIKNFADNNKVYEEYYSYMYKYISQKNEEIKAKFNEVYDETIGSDAEKRKAQYDYAEKLFQDEFKEVLDIIRDYGENITNAFEVLSNNDTNILNNSFKARLEATNEYWRETKELIIKNLKEQSKLREEAIKEQADKEYEAERERYRNQYNSLSGQASSLESDISGFSAKNSDEEEKLKKMKENLDEIYAQMETAYKQHSTKMAQINDAMTTAIKKNTFQTNEAISSEEEKYFATRLSDYRDFQSKLNDELSRNPVTDKVGFGIVDIKQTKKNYEEIINASKTALTAIKADKDRLDNLYNDGFINEEAYNTTLSQLNDLEKEMKSGMMMVGVNSKQLVGEFMQSIQQYIQAGMQALQDVMQSIWDAQDNNFDKEQEYLDKLNDELDKKLDEQQDIVQQHKDAINSIEDELATARGDRRQHLIDQLNAEMAAQRAAQQQEKKIQKEKEAAQKKQDALELKRKKAQYKRDMLQAVVNGAMAVTMAAVNSWPVPAVPMMALAAATTAAQIAIMASNKPYAKGGLLEGKSHAQGGIPIPGTGIEVEGKEYVVRKKSTAPNIDLLEYINKSERKLDLSDFIDFYSGDKPKKAIRSVRNKFEDGGYMPTLPNSLDIRDQLQNVIVNQDNRPIVVSVVDINSKQEEVRRVQTLAGLEV